jgi:hypothetical protein
MSSTYTDDREFCKVDFPSFPLKDSTKICITQLSSETSIRTWPCELMGNMIFRQIQT